MHVLRLCFPDINYGVSDKQVNKSACDAAPTYMEFQHNAIIGVDNEVNRSTLHRFC